MAVPLALVNQLSPLRFLEFCMIGLGITTLMGIGLFSLLSLINPRTSNLVRKQQELLSIAIIGVAGAFRGILIYYAIQTFHFIEPSNLLSRIGTSTTTTLLWLTAISVMLTSREKFLSDYEALLRRAIVTLSFQVSSETTSSISKQLEAELHEIEELLHVAFKDGDLPHTKRALLLGAATLKNLIEEKIRPLSHRLWIEGASSVPKVNISNSLVASIKDLDLPPAPLAIFLALTSTINITTTLGWQRGAFATVVILSEVYLLTNFYQQKIRPKNIGSFPRNTLLLLIPGLTLSGTFYISNKFLFHDDVTTLNLIYLLIFLMAALLVSGFQLANRDREKLLHDIESLLMEHGPDSEIRRSYMSENVASYLHNSLQSELLAIAGQMESSAERLDSEELKNSLDRLALRINQPIKDGLDNFLGNPLARLNKLPGAWRGIANIEISIPEEVLSDHKRNILLVQCIEEAIANAVRHSKASNVQVKAQLLEDRRVRLSVINDGEPLKAEGLGIGSAWLDFHAPHSWTRRVFEGGTDLVVTL